MSSQYSHIGNASYGAYSGGNIQHTNITVSQFSIYTIKTNNNQFNIQQSQQFYKNNEVKLPSIPAFSKK